MNTHMPKEIVCAMIATLEQNLNKQEFQQINECTFKTDIHSKTRSNCGQG